MPCRRVSIVSRSGVVRTTMSSSRVGRVRSAASGWRCTKHWRPSGHVASGSSQTLSTGSSSRSSASTASYVVAASPLHQASTSRSECVVPAAGDRGPVDHDDLQRRHPPGQVAEEIEDVVVPAQVSGHAEQYRDGVCWSPCRSSSFFLSRADRVLPPTRTDTRPPLHARGFFMPDQHHPHQHARQRTRHDARTPQHTNRSARRTTSPPPRRSGSGSGRSSTPSAPTTTARARSATR